MKNISRKMIYLIVPQKGMNGFMKGVDASKIKVVVGRGNAERERERYERELNGGQTWQESLESAAQIQDSDARAAALEKHKNEAWAVHSDTDRSWSDTKSYDEWTAAQDEVERLLNNYQ